MIIKNMFSKPIDRDIKGVIKVGQDDDANIKQELEEYVVTRELQKHFSDFFASYKRGITGNTDKMGVWISGFFGSGKSHFLKILSYLLENKEVGGKKAVDYFVDDNKISDQMVLADMKLAGTIPTDVVLFNIDSKSEVKISNENIVIADKKDKDTTKRMFRLRFNFKNKKYDKSQKYYLVAYDDKNDIEVLRHEIIMDIAFADDFGFFT